MHRHQRRRTRRIHHQTRTLKPQHIRHPVRREIQRTPRRRITIQPRNPHPKPSTAHNHSHPSPRTHPYDCPAKNPAPTPACSSASHTTSSTRRCCGSTRTASRGGIPKNPASNSRTPSTNPPCRAYVRPGTSGSASKNASTSHRSPGTNPTPDPPPVNRSQKPSTPPPEPGKRHPTPTTAIGSVNSSCAGTVPPESQVRSGCGIGNGAPFADVGVGPCAAGPGSDGRGSATAAMRQLRYTRGFVTRGVRDNPYPAYRGSRTPV